MTHTAVAARPDHSVIQKRLITAMLGLLVGSMLLLGAGFADSGVLHDAAHDARHAHTFPCH